MLLVVDTNVAVSALLRSGETRRLVISGRFDLICPDHALLEIAEHRVELVKKMGLNASLFEQSFDLVKENMKVIPLEEYVSFKPHALKLSVTDHDDWPFLALALKHNCPVWSNDAGLKKQFKIPVFTTAELLKLE